MSLSPEFLVLIVVPYRINERGSPKSKLVLKDAFGSLLLTASSEGSFQDSNFLHKQEFSNFRRGVNNSLQVYKGLFSGKVPHYLSSKNLPTNWHNFGV